MSTSASRCDQIIALIDACLAEIEATPAAPAGLAGPRSSRSVRAGSTRLL